MMLASAIDAANRSALLIDGDPHQSFKAYQTYSLQAGPDSWSPRVETRFLHYETTPLLTLEDQLLDADESGRYDWCLTHETPRPPSPRPSAWLGLRGPVQDFETALRQVSGEFCAPLFQSNAGNAEGTAKAIGNLSSQWAAIESQWGANPHPHYLDDLGFAATPVQVETLAPEAQK